MQWLHTLHDFMLAGFVSLIASVLLFVKQKMIFRYASEMINKAKWTAPENSKAIDLEKDWEENVPEDWVKFANKMTLILMVGVFGLIALGVALPDRKEAPKKPVINIIYHDREIYSAEVEAAASSCADELVDVILASHESLMEDCLKEGGKSSAQCIDETDHKWLLATKGFVTSCINSKLHGQQENQ